MDITTIQSSDGITVPAIVSPPKLSKAAAQVIVENPLEAQTNIITLFSNIGDNSITNQKAAQIIAIENKISEIAASAKDSPLEYRNLGTLTQGVSSFKDYFLDSGLMDKSETVSILLTNYLVPLIQNILNNKEYSLDDLKAYIKFRLLLKYEMPDIKITHFVKKDQGKAKSYTLSNAKHNIFLKLSDTFGDSDLNKLCLNAYVENHRSKFLEIIKNVILVYRNKIQSASSISNSTKQKLLQKINPSMDISIAFEPQSANYSQLDLSRNNPVNNIRAVSELKYKYMLDQIGKPFSPDTQLAFYPENSIKQTKIIIPLLKMIPPYFDPNNDDPVIEYGSTGAFVGMQIGYIITAEALQKANPQRDIWQKKLDQLQKQNAELAQKISSKYSDLAKETDEKLKSYKTTETKDDKITPEGRRIIQSDLEGQYIGYSNLQLIYHVISSKYTTSNNAYTDIAYIMGLAAAYDAYHISLQGKSAPTDITGITGDQRFYYSFAQRFKENRCIVTQWFTPDLMLVNGVLEYQGGFKTAFGLKNGDGMLLDPKKHIDFLN